MANFSLCLPIVLLAILRLSIGSLLPSSRVGSHSAVGSVPVVHNINRFKHGGLEYYKALSKYRRQIPSRLQHVVSHLTVPQQGSAQTMSEDGDLEWLAPAFIGSPPQQLFMDFDTGSADTWVFSTDTKRPDVKGQVLYDPGASKTAALVPNVSWSIVYGDFSSSSGIVYRDTVTLGQGVAIRNATVESAQTVSDQFSSDIKSSGIVGLGFPELIETTPVQKAMLDFLPEVLEKPLFTADLQHNGTGSYNFGFVDDSLHVSNITYIDVDATGGFWNLSLKGFMIPGQTWAYSFEDPYSVIADTGTTLIYLPEELVTQYWNSTPGSYFSYEDYGYIVPCNSTPPDLTVIIGDATGNMIYANIPGSYMKYGLINGEPGEDGMCYGGLQEGEFGEGVDGILGDILIKSGFAVFDIGNKQFGWAPKSLDL